MSDIIRANAPQDRARRIVDGEVQPCADDIVILQKAGEWKLCGPDGAGPCLRKYCYGDGPNCPRVESCGCLFVPGVKASRGRYQFIEPEEAKKP